MKTLKSPNTFTTCMPALSDESCFQFEDDVAEQKFFHTSVMNRLLKPDRSKLFEVLIVVSTYTFHICSWKGGTL